VGALILSTPPVLMVFKHSSIAWMEQAWVSWVCYVWCVQRDSKKKHFL